MPTITINGVECDFSPGQTIIQVANANGIDIPQYCYHDGLSIAASCRICLAQCWAPNPRNDNTIEPMMGGKLVPTCQTPASDGMVVRTDTPDAVRNQKSVMEYLLINHPLDCPVCDQAGECDLQDYSYKYGRGVSRFQEQKVKNPKKDVGPHIYLYSDRCIMCTRCVRFTREVTGTDELMVAGRGNQESIDVFPGVALDNELAGNVVDLCPVGSLLDKDFLFAQRVWFLKSTPSIDGITSSGDNLWVDHNEGKVYRLRPRENMSVNKWWITDEVRYGWKHVHAENRLRSPMTRSRGVLTECDFNRAYDDASKGLAAGAGTGGLVVVVSPMLTCEEAYVLTRLGRQISDRTTFVLGPVPSQGQDKLFPPGVKAEDPKAFRLCSEKAPNARGVRRVIQGVTGSAPIEFDKADAAIAGAGAVIVTGNYPSQWAPDAFVSALAKPFVVLIDTLGSPAIESADVVLPGATWLEKAGTFENHAGRLQSFEQAIPVIEMAKTEGQIALDLSAVIEGLPDMSDRVLGVRVVDEGPGQVPAAVSVLAPRGRLFNAANLRAEMAQSPSLSAFVADVHAPAIEHGAKTDMPMMSL